VSWLELASKELVFEVRRLATVHQFPVQSAQQYHVLQLAESDNAHEIAERIAEVVHGVSLEELTDRRDQSTCRFLAVEALRRTQDCWTQAATEAAIQRAEYWMRHEGGALFRGCSDQQLSAIARMLAPQVLAAYHGITEGTAAMLPGVYLDIVNGSRK
jgi:hypothetical protein